MRLSQIGMCPEVFSDRLGVSGESIGLGFTQLFGGRRRDDGVRGGRDNRFGSHADD